MAATVSVGECLKTGWNIYKKRPGIFIKMVILLFVISMAFNIVGSTLDSIQESAESAAVITAAIASIIISIASVYIGIVVNNMGAFTFHLKAYDDVGSVRLKDLWRPHPFWRFLFASLLVGVIVIVGFILLIVPGVILALALSMTMYLILERDIKIVDAIKESMRLTKGNRWKLFVLTLAVIGINIIGMLPLLLGLLVTVPVSALAYVHAYRVLAAEKDALQAVPVAA